MLQEADLDKQVQSVINGGVAGDEARKVLCEALVDLYKMEQKISARRANIERAERALVYGIGRGRRPMPPLPLGYLGSVLTLEDAARSVHAASCAGDGPAIDCYCTKSISATTTL